VALSSGSKDVTVAEGNRAILEAFRSPVFRNFTDDILSKVHVVDYEAATSSPRPKRSSTSST